MQISTKVLRSGGVGRSYTSKVEEQLALRLQLLTSNTKKVGFGDKVQWISSPCGWALGILTLYIITMGEISRVSYVRSEILETTKSALKIGMTRNIRLAAQKSNRGGYRGARVHSSRDCESISLGLMEGPKQGQCEVSQVSFKRNTWQKQSHQTQSWSYQQTDKEGGKHESSVVIEMDLPSWRESQRFPGNGKCGTQVSKTPWKISKKRWV